MILTNVTIPEYAFDDTNNPYSFDCTQPKPLRPMADAIEKAIKEAFGSNNLLVRGIQSGCHKPFSNDEFIRNIFEHGSDKIIEGSDGKTIFAAIIEDETILSILNGFHTYKPKCDERPQYPVDVWLVFDPNAFTNIEYIHPRHNVVARDKWARKNDTNDGLLGILTVNNTILSHNEVQS